MKCILLSVLAIFLLQINALADQTGSVSITAAAPTQSLQIIDQKFDPIYGDVPYETTCSRDVYDHTDTECHTVMDSVCHGGGEVCETTSDSVCNSHGCTSVPRRSCHTTSESCSSVPRNACSSHSVYRTEYYSCTKIHTVQVGQKLVKTYHHQIEVALDESAQIADATLQVEVRASEAGVAARLANSFPSAILTYDANRVLTQDTGADATITSRITIKSGLAAEVIRKINTAQLTNLALGQSGVKFDLLGAGALKDFLRVGVNLVHYRWLLSNQTLYDNAVHSASLGLVSSGENLSAIVPFAKLGIDSIGTAKYNLAVHLSLDLGQTLNAKDFQAELAKSFELSLTKVHPTF